jgi:cyclase
MRLVMAHHAWLCLGLSGFLAVSADAQPSSVTSLAFPEIQGRLYQFERVAEGVYYASGGFGGKHMVVVNDDDVLLVDTATTPASARALVEDIRVLTDKPVRYVVNTHFHYDHTDGNSIFGPEVTIIGHDFVREAILNFDVLRREPYLSSQGTAVPARIAALRQQLAVESDPARRSTLMRDIDTAEATQRELQAIEPTPPNLTFSRRLVLHRGSREIELLFLGRGHTAGDTVVFLPAERIVATGDLMESRLAYMGDAYFDEWIATLEVLKELDFDLILPGHDVPFRGKSLISAFQDYLADFIAQGDALRRAGVTVEEAAQRIDLTAHAGAWPQITGPGAELRGMRRLYAWLAEREGD